MSIWDACRTAAASEAAATAAGVPKAAGPANCWLGACEAESEAAATCGSWAPEADALVFATRTANACKAAEADEPEALTEAAETDVPATARIVFCTSTSTTCFASSNASFRSTLLINWPVTF